MITPFQADVLLHTSSNGRYVTDEKAVIEMGESGLLYDYGPQPLAGGAHYLVTTAAGRAALNEWKSAQPKPKTARRRRSEQFEAWQRFCEAFKRVPFTEFLKDFWPHRHSL